MKFKSFHFKTIVVLGCVVLLFGCKEENNDPPNPSDVVTLASVDVTTTLDPSKLYLVEDAVQVNADLVIPAGTVIKFKPGMRIDINAGGSITAIGTAAAPIVFTSIKDDSKKGDTNGDLGATVPAPKDWGCITAAGNPSTFTYCEFYYGGGWGDHTATLEIRCLASVTFCTFGFNYGGMLNDNLNGALNLLAADLASMVKSNQFYGNDIPMAINANMSMDGSNAFHKSDDISITNRYNGIFVEVYTVSNTVAWSENEVPFILTEHIGIENSASLTLQPDVALKMYPDTRIDIIDSGTLNHNGAIITSFKDDACMGDSNGDGTATAPAFGDWVGINLGFGNYMTGANIRYAAH